MPDTAAPGPRTRHVYVISDLHLGGAWPSEDSRGFRMMTHPTELARFIHAVARKPSGPDDPDTELVINGDFVDFLAEEHDRPRWKSFIRDPEVAVRVFETVANRPGDAEVFDALAALIARGHILTVLLGNHDIELSFPAVRRAFETRIGVGPRSPFRFFYDGEAYEVGTALIEHGNRYDPANTVDHGQLHRIRSLQSRKRLDRETWSFDPPVGSRIVAELMNPIKSDYQFIDLLKPESEPLFALLLALEPRYKELIKQMAKLLSIGLGGVRKKRERRGRFAMMFSDSSDAEGDGAADGDGDGEDGDEGDNAALLQVLQRAVPAAAASDLVSASNDDVGEPESATSDEIAAAAGGRQGPLSFGLGSAVMGNLGAGARSRLGLAGLLVGGQLVSVSQRLGLVQQALRAVDQDRSFEDGFEASRRYLDAARDLSRRYSIVVFGHTHHAKDIELSRGARYLNTGTWANLMRFPAALFDNDPAVATSALQSFFENLRKNRLSEYIEFRPTYARLSVATDGTTEGAIHTYDAERDEV